MQRLLGKTTFLLIAILLIPIFSGCMPRQNSRETYNLYNYNPDYKTCREKRYSFKSKRNNIRNKYNFKSKRDNIQNQYKYNYKYDEALIQEEIDTTKKNPFVHKQKKVSKSPWFKKKEKPHPYYYDEGEFPSNVPRNSIQ